jgi:hypothetical protein
MDTMVLLGPRQVKTQGQWWILNYYTGDLGEAMLLGGMGAAVVFA